MPILRKSRSSQHTDTPESSTIGHNPRRDEHLFWWTDDGYIVAQDVNCQYEYVTETHCPECGGSLRVMAHINRAGQGLSELAAMCVDCHVRGSFIFDISNDVFQAWWAEQLGSMYVRQYDGPTRLPHLPE